MYRYQALVKEQNQFFEISIIVAHRLEVQKQRLRANPSQGRVLGGVLLTAVVGVVTNNYQ